MKTSLDQCPDHLSEDQINQFQRDGYLAFSDILSASEVEEARTALRKLGDQIAIPENLVVGGKGQKFYFQEREGGCMVQLEPDYDPRGKSADEIELNIRKYWKFRDEDAFFQKMLAPKNRVLKLISSLIGENPIFFQDMALVKPPFIGTEKPWHQDNAYFSVKPLEAVVGIWIALDDTAVENGCMHVLPGGHKAGALKHFHSSDCEIMHDRIDTTGAVAVPVPAGGGLLFYGLLPHNTPPNRSAQRRRALQFHFRSAKSEIVDRETYDRVFAERDGTPASCAAAR